LDSNRTLALGTPDAGMAQYQRDFRNGARIVRAHTFQSAALASERCTCCVTGKSFAHVVLLRDSHAHQALDRVSVTRPV
jgi:hypothetical protein